MDALAALMLGIAAMTGMVADMKPNAARMKAAAAAGYATATDLADYRTRNHVFAEITTYSDFRPVLTGAGEPERAGEFQSERS